MKVSLTGSSQLGLYQCPGRCAYSNTPNLSNCSDICLVAGCDTKGDELATLELERNRETAGLACCYPACCSHVATLQRIKA